MFNFLVFDGDDLVAGFVSLCAAETFIEDWRADSPIPVTLADNSNGMVVNTWVNGAWTR